jgi:two-component system sensor histidine kinase HydH
MNGSGGSTPGGTPSRPIRPRRTRSEAPAKSAATSSHSEALASLGALAGDLAHEIRNPLVALKSFLELLPERRGDPELETRFLEIAREELRRAERLLDAMVDARRGGGLRAPPGEVEAAVGAVATLLGPRARERGVRLEIFVEPRLPAVALGADALRQVLLNLALNALDASPRDARIDISARAVGEGVEISLADEGPGLPPGDRAQLRTGRRPGGLGLAITRRLLAAVGGTLRAGAATGSGTLVRAWAPAAPRSASASR